MFHPLKLEHETFGLHLSLQRKTYHWRQRQLRRSKPPYPREKSSLSHPLKYKPKTPALPLMSSPKQAGT